MDSEKDVILLNPKDKDCERFEPWNPVEQLAKEIEKDLKS